MPTLATRKPGRFAAAGVAAALLAMPVGVQAKDGCELIEAMLAKRDSWLKGVGVAVNGKGLVDATLGGKPAVLRDARRCSLDSPKSGFELGCDWDYAAGQDAAARRDFERLAGRIGACLPEPVTAVAPVTYTEAKIKELAAEYGPSFEEYVRSNRDLGHFEGSYTVDEAQDISLRVSLSLDRDDRNGSLQLSASFERY